MNEDINKLALDLRGMIGQARQIHDTTDFNSVFITAENIIGTLAYLISPLTHLEQKYRNKVVYFMEEGDSTAKAEAKARASDEYVEYKKYDMLYNLGHEQVLLLKRFTRNLELEHQRS